MARDTAPIPKVHRQKHTPQTDRWKRQLTKNWKTCDSKWWDYTPNDRFYFAVKDKKKMIKLLTRDDLEQIEIQVESGIGTYQIALAMEMPYDFLEWWIKTTSRSSFAALKTKRDKLTLQQRRKRLLACLMDEMEDRLASRVARKSMSPMDILKVSKELINEINMEDKGPQQDLPQGPKLVRPETMTKEDEKTTDRSEEAAADRDSVGVQTH